MARSARSKRSRFIARRTERGDIAIWLTHGLWLAGIRDGLSSGYIFNRESMGREQANKEAGKREVGDGWGFSECNAREALELYTLGYDLHTRKFDEDNGEKHPLTPKRLVEIGDRAQARCHEERKAILDSDAQKVLPRERSVA